MKAWLSPALSRPQVLEGGDEALQVPQEIKTTPSHLCPAPALGLSFFRHTVGLEWWDGLSKDGVRLIAATEMWKGRD